MNIIEYGERFDVMELMLLPLCSRLGGFTKPTMTSLLSDDPKLKNEDEAMVVLSEHTSILIFNCRGVFSSIKLYASRLFLKGEREKGEV